MEIQIKRYCHLREQVSVLLVDLGEFFIQFFGLTIKSCKVFLTLLIQLYLPQTYTNTQTNNQSVVIIDISILIPTNKKQNETS